MTQRILLFTATLLLATSFTWYAQAQDETDALRYSQLSPQGTARSVGFGGALGAIGGDFSSLSVNPAGIGVYRGSELTFTPSLKLNSTSSTYTGATSDDNNTRFNVNNLGVVFTNAASGARYKKSKWKAISFGFGLNRIADFSSNHTYSGFNNTSSASEVYLAQALSNEGNLDIPGSRAWMGYESYLVDIDSFGLYKVPDFNTGLDQTRTVEQRGGITDFNFSFGGNYEEKLMLGATVGIPSIRYNRNVTFRESDASGDTDNGFDFFEYTEALKVRGTGVNLKLGIIYNIAPTFKAGLALHTPTYFSITEEQSQSITSNTENLKFDINAPNSNPTTMVDAPINDYAYTIITPWKAVLSMAGIIAKRGFISVDYEYVDYSSARYSFEVEDSRYQNEVNTNIKNMYRGASNLRIGGEVKFDIVMLRVGFGYYGNPYQNTAMGSETISGSAGVGLRFDNIFIDLGFNRSSTTIMEQPYAIVYENPREVIDVPSATIETARNNVALTFGVKF